MSKKEKVANYTPEMTSDIVKTYLANQSKETVTALATKHGKNEKSIIAKLSREGVYKKAEYVTKAGEKPVMKDKLAEAIGKEIGVDADDAKTLSKANKTVLSKLVAALKITLTEEDAEQAAEPEAA